MIGGVKTPFILLPLFVDVDIIGPTKPSVIIREGFLINMRICLCVIANYVYRANCRQDSQADATTTTTRIKSGDLS